MNSPTLEQRKELWKLVYARASFVDSRDFAVILLGLTKNDRCKYKAITMAMTIAYSRPFKQRRGVKLGEEVVPVEYLETHRGIIEHRDKVIAHRDLDGPVAEWGFASELVLDVSHEEVGFETLSPVAPHDLAKDVINLSEKLIARMDGLIKPIITEIGRWIPGRGKFVLNLTDSGPWIEVRDRKG
jgi:hypothetical protein